MFEKLLIANRGEIACRIITTARRLGVGTVAVYSEADVRSRHAVMADEAWPVGPSPARESYLAAEKIIEAARRSGAAAIHPGYGFLSENADFAEACAAAGLLFVGPPPAAIRAMGSKSAAKAIMGSAGVPLVPGYHGEDQDPVRLLREAECIGWPVLIKASAGGGGKGMRVVRNAAEFSEALAGARRESAAAFGDDRVLLEKYLTRPRHVEIQVFADTQGNAVHLFERDCSLQRRHQKVVEEAPAPGLTEQIRSRMGAAAVTAARAIGYVGAGTVEFLLDADGSFFFMEMNTRLQVEHPVTEMVTGQDLVEWQLRVAAGEPLPCRQEELAIDGHAVEVRLYAEDPARDFLPSVGRLDFLREPQQSRHVRIDTGVRAGDDISPWYDPMIAKLIVWDSDRQGALRRLRRALDDYQVAGLSTNLEFLAAVASHRAFAAGEVDTGFLDRHREDLIPAADTIPDRVLACACLEVLLRRDAEARVTAADSPDPHSPFHMTTGWRLNADNHHVLTFHNADVRLNITAHYRPGGFLLELPGGPVLASGILGAEGDLDACLDGVRTRVTVVRRGAELTVLGAGPRRVLTLDDPLQPPGAETGGEGRLTAPMPGRIVAVMVEAGAEVRRGTPLLILEAMKMEHTITAPDDGTIAKLPYAVGAQVKEGAELVSFQPAEG